MIAWVLVLTQAGDAGRPTEVRIEIGSVRLSEALRRVGAEAGVPLGVNGPWDPLLRAGLREGALWAVLDSLAAEAGARLEIDTTYAGGYDGLPRRVRFTPGGVDPLAVAYAGPVRVCATGIGFEHRIGEEATPPAGWILVEAWPEPWAGMGSPEWSVKEIRSGDRLATGRVEAGDWGDAVVRFVPPAAAATTISVRLRLRAECLSGVQSAFATYRDLCERSDILVGTERVRIHRFGDDPPEGGGASAWQGTLEWEGAPEGARIDLAVTGDARDDGGEVRYVYVEAGDVPGQARGWVEWAGRPDADRRFRIRCARGTVEREWEVRFEDLPFPGIGR